MKIRILIAIFLVAAINSTIAATPNCDSYRNKIDRLQSLNAKGGKAKQQETRRKQISHYEDELRKCSNTQTIAIVSNNQKQKIKTKPQKLRSSKIQNPKLQQLIKTCNYWIEENNNKPSWDNTNFRDTACRAADDSESAIDNPAPPITPNSRKLKDCIKPNNVIDDEVNECMKGTREADWRLL